jgi:predicted helicase
MKWIRKTKRFFARGVKAQFEAGAIVPALYRPFVRNHVFFDRMFSEDVYSLPALFCPQLPNQRALVVTGVGMRSPFSVLATVNVPEHHLCASTDAFQVLPLRRLINDVPQENVTDWALAQFRAYYHERKITEWDIFHYVYGLLQHPEYHARYETDLKRELPRIPFAPDFRAFASAGEKLAALHIDYEVQPEYPLRRLESKDLPLDWRVERMRLSKDRTQLAYNDFLTLAGIPPEAFEYRLGNRSALEWVIDQYQVSTDKRSGILNDPNRPDDPEYIVRLIGQVITVSLETLKIVRALPSFDGPRSTKHA